MKVRPSAWWYVLVPIAFLTGIGYGIAGVIDEGRSVASSFARLGEDGRGTIELDAGDEATVFAIWLDDRNVQTSDRPAADVTIVGADGNPVAFDEAGAGEQTFTIEGTSGLDLGTFEAQESGTHEVRVVFGQPGMANGADVLNQPQAAVGRLDWRALVGSLLRPIGIGAIAGLAIWIALVLTRGASKRRARSVGPTAPGNATHPVSGNRGPFV